MTCQGWHISFSIAFNQQTIYHATVTTRSIESSFQSDIKPSDDGYAFRKLGLFLQGCKYMNYLAFSGYHYNSDITRNFAKTCYMVKNEI